MSSHFARAAESEMRAVGSENFGTPNSVKILNRKGLEQSARECYSLIQGYNGELAR
jgi:hypothetical protein